jgi:hypothetical protein
MGRWCVGIAAGVALVVGACNDTSGGPLSDQQCDSAVSPFCSSYGVGAAGAGCGQFVACGTCLAAPGCGWCYASYVCAASASECPALPSSGDNTWTSDPTACGRLADAGGGDDAGGSTDGGASVDAADAHGEASIAADSGGASVDASDAHDDTSVATDSGGANMDASRADVAVEASGSD